MYLLADCMSLKTPGSTPYFLRTLMTFFINFLSV